MGGFVLGLMPSPSSACPCCAYCLLMPCAGVGGCLRRAVCIGLGGWLGSRRMPLASACLRAPAALLRGPLGPFLLARPWASAL
eukprot:6020808-Alexandrium_andersonii.AAC.1